ncbi:hypothetical protein EIP75_09490 [Aquabacterium soli]|uniref:Uncharacterized protein n=1 Tax=Aquabacterium soli TaxID=2493092 RepID=A0A3R8TCI9_9BURK|nr:hypothetical protein [Aquabacterium soli]RRS04643.1 hypothetical protein EIP75_09490 [Aquabacterium soli]
MNILPAHTRALGKFVFSAFSQQTDCGQHQASLSIRSGRGRGTHDRVFRFVPLFTTPQAAIHYALAQGEGCLHLSGLSA